MSLVWLFGVACYYRLLLFVISLVACCDVLHLVYWCLCLLLFVESVCVVVVSLPVLVVVYLITMIRVLLVYSHVCWLVVVVSRLCCCSR